MKLIYNYFNQLYTNFGNTKNLKTIYKIKYTPVKCFDNLAAFKI